MLRSCYYIAIILLFTQCNTATQNSPAKKQHPAPPAKVYTTIKTSYRALSSKDSIRNIGKYFSPAQQNIILDLNRVDADNIAHLDTVIVPADMSGEVMQYTIYPQRLPFLEDVHKIIFFSYPAQYFAAYENGYLVLSGPTNMGRKHDPTPTGLFYTNWKAEKTTSTFNDEWELKWNFNIQNKAGVGFHEYALPGYPASHSCLRLLEGDAKYLYNWAEQWVLKGTDDIQAYGTPVVVFGTYPFGSPKPWLQLLQNPNALDLSADQLKTLTDSYMPDIMAKEQQRDSLATKAP